MTSRTKAKYPSTRTYYERIEPVAESFPDNLDPRIDLREADLEPGQRWTGFHRLEKDLWVTGPQPDTNAVADQLLADVKELHERVEAPDYTIHATQIAGGAQGLLDEVAASKITGEEDIFSHTDLWDFYANVEGPGTAVVRCGRSSTSGTPNWASGSTDGSRRSSRCWTSIARVTASCRTTP